MKNLNLRKAFTLIELLVVIAIIAILASILIPVVTSALDDAKIANMRDTGVGIYKSIFAADADDPVFGGNTVVWPGSRDTNSWQNSNDYFVHLLREDFIESDFSLFSGPGLLKIKDTNAVEFVKDANAWGVTLDVANKNASIPFLFSRNVDATGDLLPKASSKEPLLSLITPEDALPPEAGRILKFHEKAVVVISKGGSGLIIKKKNLTAGDTIKNFNPTDRDLPILLPDEPTDANEG